MTDAPFLPRYLAFQGQVEARAFGFSRALFAEAALRERVFSLWQGGARLEEFEWGHVLWLSRPVRVRVALAPALPLVWFGRGFSGAPLEGKAPESGVWIVEGGQWRELQDGTPVDVSRWLDVGAWSVAASQSLGEVAALPSVLSPVELDLRTQSGIGAPDEKWQTIWERETKMSRAGASGLIERLARWITPRRDAGAVPLVSNARIVWSSAVALCGSGLFCLAAFFDPPRVPGISLVSLVGVAGALLLISIAIWLCGRLPRSASRPRVARASAPLVVLPAMVQTLVLAIVTVGVVRIAVWNIESLFKTLLVLLLLWGASRALRLTGRLVGSRAVGTSDALLLWPF